MPTVADTALPDACDVAIVGGGPAGLAAASRLKALGVGSVCVLEREEEAGGIPRHCGHYPFGMREFHRLLRGPDYAARLVGRARAAGVAIHCGTTVVRIGEGPRLVLSTPDGPRELMARRVLLCTGVRERSRAARLIGGQRPLGVVSTGALQSMVYLKHLRPFARPVILGTELVSFSAILTCRHAGARPVAMLEEGARIVARGGAGALPRLLGIPLHLNCRLVAIRGEARVEGVVVEERGGRREIAADGVVVTGNFTPEATLLRMGHLEVDEGSGGPAIDQHGRCSDPAFFAAGNLLRPVETAGWSWREGVTVAEALWRDLSGALPEGPAVAIRPVHPALRFVLPQTLRLPLDGTGLHDAQLRVGRPVRGRLVARSGGRTIWSRAIDALPERRVLVPLEGLARAASGSVEIDVEEEGS